MTEKTTTFDDFLSWTGLSEEIFNLNYPINSSNRLHLFLSYALSQKAVDINFWKEGLSSQYGFGFRAAGAHYRIPGNLSSLSAKILPSSKEEHFALTIYLFGLDSFNFRFRVEAFSDNGLVKTHITMRLIPESSSDLSSNLNDNKIDLIYPMVQSLLLKEKLEQNLSQKEIIPANRLKI